jgi:pantothenate kinase
MDLCREIFVRHLLIYFVVDIPNEIFLEQMKVSEGDV